VNHFSRRWLGAAALLFLCAPVAQAHVVETGFGPLVDTLVHMFVGPDAVLSTLAVGIFCGLRSPKVARGSMALFLYGWAIFYFVGFYLQYPFDFPYHTALSLTGAGFLLAADFALPDRYVYGVAAWVGGLFGLVGGGTTEGVQHSLVFVMAIADFALLWGLFAIAAHLSHRFPKARIAFRVAGSWITAVGMLQFGWTFRAPPPLP